MGIIFQGPLMVVLFIIVALVLAWNLFQIGVKLIFLIIGLVGLGIIILVFPALLLVFFFVLLPILILFKIIF